MRLLPVLLVALLLLPAAVSQPSRTEPAQQMPGGEIGGGYVGFAWAHTPGELKGVMHPVVGVDGVAVKLWLRIHAPISATDVLHVSASAGTLNRTEVPVTLEADKTLSVPFTYTASAATERSTTLSVRLNDTRSPDGRPIDYSTHLQIVPPVSLGFVSPQPEYMLMPWGGEQAVPRHVGSATPLEFRILAKNHGATAAAASTVTLTVYGRAIREVALPTLAPGESKEVSFGEIRLAADLPEYAPSAQYGGVVGLDFTLAHGSSGTDRNAWRFDLVDGVPTGLRIDVLQVQYHAGILAQAESVNLTLGQPSWIDVSVTNYGEDTATNVRIDIRASAVPPANYGPGTYLKETRYVTVAPLETKHINLTFVPRVAGQFQVTVEAFVPGFYSPIQRSFDLYTPVTITPSEAPNVVVGTLGAERTIMFAVNSSVDLTGAELGFAVTSQNVYRGEVPYVRFLSRDDVVRVTATPEKFDLVGNATVWINATLDLAAAGSYYLVPYLKVGDTVYVGRPITGGGDGGFDGRPHFSGGGGVALPGHYELRIQADTFAIARLWFPVGGMMLGFVGYWVWRRRAVL